MRPALFRGWRKACPRCGKGAAIHKYLKVQDSCPNCSQALHHHRADDGPAFLTILLVGHLMAPVIHFSYAWTSPDPIIAGLVMAALAAGLAMLLLPRVKGVIVAFQWAKRMGGFGHEPDAAEGLRDV